MAGLFKFFRQSDDLVTLEAYKLERLNQLPREVVDFLFEIKIYPDEAESRFQELLTVLLVHKYGKGAKRGNVEERKIAEVLLALLEKEENASQCAGDKLSPNPDESEEELPRSPQRSPRAGRAAPVKLRLARTKYKRQNTPLTMRRLTASAKEFRMFLKPMAYSDSEPSASASASEEETVSALSNQSAPSRLSAECSDTSSGDRAEDDGELLVPAGEASPTRSPTRSPRHRGRSPAMSRRGGEKLDLSQEWKHANPHDFYSNMHPIGEGAYGAVYLATKTGATAANLEARVAIKKLNAHKSKELMMAAKEVMLLRKAEHKYVTKLLEVLYHDNNAWLVMEYCDGGTLEQMLETVRLTEPQAKFVLKKLLMGIAYLHSQRILHRDLKSANVMLNFDARVKIGDLGLAVQHQQIDTPYNHGPAGTPRYMAPEVALGAEYSSKADIWSFGCIAFETIAQQHVHAGYHAIKSLFRSATRGAPALPPKMESTLSPEAKDFLQSCLHFDMDRRWSAASLLKHPWFQGPCKPDELLDLMETAFLGRALKAAGIGFDDM